MKRYIAIVISIIIILSSINIISFAYEEKDKGNNFYIIVEITEEINTVRASGTKTGSKTISGYNGETKLWDATIKGTFTYSGSSSTCTSASITYNMYESSWKITSATATKNGNKAVGDVTAKHYLLGIPVKTVEQTVTLTCSASGVLS